MPVSSLATATLRTAFLVVLGVLYLGVAVTSAQEGRKDAMGDQLLEAVAEGDAASVRELLAASTSTDARDASGRTALLLATRADNLEIARLLIEAGADVNAKDGMEDTPFLYAGAEGRNEILKLILQHGPKLDDTNRYGGTALIPAAHHGHPETVSLLLAAGVDVDHVNKLGWTALLEAVILGDGGPTYVKIVELLLGGGTDWRIADREGVTALGHARRRGFQDIAARLQAAAGG